MAKRSARFGVPVAVTAASLFSMSAATTAAAAQIRVVTPGEQNTQSGENGCEATPCAAGHWLHYPELLQAALGAGYTVQNDGDGGAVLGCDAASAAAAGGGSFCKSNQYNMSIAPVPDVVIIGPFGEHDQRIITAAGNMGLYSEAAFEAAYEGLVTNYLNLSSHPKIYMMTPIDLAWGGTTALPAGEDLVKDIMLPAAMAVAHNHNLTIVDTYTAITPGGTVIAEYNGTDGQVTSAGQQKMAELILDAFQSDGGTSGEDAAADTGTGANSGTSTSGTGTSGGSAGSGTASAGTAATTGATANSGSSASGTTGTAGSSGSVAAMSGSTASGATNGGSGSTANSGAGGASGTNAASGTTTATTPSASSGCSCSLTGVKGPSWGAALGLLSLGFVGFARRRRS